MQGSEAEGFAFERLEVSGAYQRALEFLVVAARIISELPGGNASLTDQLPRAALSVPVNLAEGVGRSSVADRRRHYAIARALVAQRWNVPRFSMLAWLCSWRARTCWDTAGRFCFASSRC